MRQSSSTGPSRNACSSTESTGFGSASSAFQSGLPLKSSPSKPTVPASSAICSVSESLGMTFWNIASTGALSLRRRNGTRFSGTAIAAKTTSGTTIAAAEDPASQPAARIASATAAVHGLRPMRK
jgi:hypothetical protein